MFSHMAFVSLSDLFRRGDGTSLSAVEVLVTWRICWREPNRSPKLALVISLGFPSRGKRVQIENLSDDRTGNSPTQ